MVSVVVSVVVSSGQRSGQCSGQSSGPSGRLYNDQDVRDSKNSFLLFTDYVMPLFLCVHASIRSYGGW